MLCMLRPPPPQTGDSSAKNSPPSFLYEVGRDSLISQKMLDKVYLVRTYVVRINDACFYRPRQFVDQSRWPKIKMNVSGVRV